MRHILHRAPCYRLLVIFGGKRISLLLFCLLASISTAPPTFGRNSEPDQQEKCGESWYLTFRNAGPIYIADSEGHQTKRIGDFLNVDVPGVTYHQLSGYDALIILWSHTTYTLTWTVPKSGSLSLDIVRGCNIDAPNEAVHYEGVPVVAGTEMELKIDRNGPLYLRYDKNKNGKYEQTIKPDFIAHDAAAKDVTGPGIMITIEKIDDTRTTVKITASDPSGIHDLQYFTDEEGPDGYRPHKYTEPFTIDPGKVKVITAFTHDGVGNQTILSKVMTDEFIVKILESNDGIEGYNADLTLQSFNGKEPYTADWDFGDGKTQSGAWHRAVHTYQKPGQYKVTLTVTDSLDRKAQNSINITVPAKTASKQ